MLLEELQALAPNTRLYPDSLQRAGGETYIFAQDGHQHYLLIGYNPTLPPFGRDTFGGEVQDFDSQTALKWCLPSHSNARKMRRFFAWTSPRVLGNQPTFGGDDPFGLAGAAHIRAARECGIEAALVLARYWVGETEETGRSAEDVLDAATWAVFQENYRAPWGAEAVVQNEDEARRLEAFGFTIFAAESDNARHIRTSDAWLAALRALSQVQPTLFREICDFAGCAPQWSDDARQVLEAEFDTIINGKNERGAWLFRPRIYRALLDHEAEHFECVIAQDKRVFESLDWIRQQEQP